MFKVSVVEKVLGQVVVNTYELKTEDQLKKFTQMCKEDGSIVMVRSISKAAVKAS